MSYQKIYWDFTCPYCKHTSNHKVYPDQTYMFCHNEKCGKEYSVEITVTQVEVKTFKK